MKTDLKKGDVVICINAEPLKGNDIGPPLLKDHEYTVQGICVTPGTVAKPDENHHIDVGLESKINYVTCYETKKEIPGGDKIHWCHPSRFKLKEE